MYSALWIYFCVYSKKNYKKIICKKNITILSVTLLIPFILGYIYHLAPGIYNILNTTRYEAVMDSKYYASNIVNNTFKLYGYIYVNYYSNILVLIPFILYYIYKKIKEKKVLSFDTILLVFITAYIGILLTGLKLELVSEYFLMKNYYALWVLVIYMAFRGIMYIFEKKEIIASIIVTGYAMTIIISLMITNVPLGKGPGNENENILSITEVFGVNKTIIKYREIDYELEEIELLRYAKENFDLENDKIEIMGDSEQLFWAYSLLRYVNHDKILENKDYDGQTRLTLKAEKAYQKIGKVDYMIYFNRSSYYKESEDKILNNGEIIFENDLGGIIKYNK